MYKLGLIGKRLNYSFSKSYFEKKFKTEFLKNFSYSLYELGHIKEIKDLLRVKNLIGLNITSPYKKSIIKYTDELDETSKKIGAINTIFIHQNKSQMIYFQFILLI